MLLTRDFTVLLPLKMLPALLIGDMFGLEVRPPSPVLGESGGETSSGYIEDERGMSKVGLFCRIRVDGGEYVEDTLNSGLLLEMREV